MLAPLKSLENLSLDGLEYHLECSPLCPQNISGRHYHLTSDNILNI